MESNGAPNVRHESFRDDGNDAALEAAVSDTNNPTSSTQQESNPASSSAPDCGESESPTNKKKYKPYMPWSKEHVMMLRDGVRRHGLGRWEIIRQDPDFKPLLQRTGVQLKDKWRNLVKFKHLTEEEKQAVEKHESSAGTMPAKKVKLAESILSGGPKGLALPSAMAHPDSAEILRLISSQLTMPGPSRSDAALDAEGIARLERIRCEFAVQQAKEEYTRAKAKLGEALAMRTLPHMLQQSSAPIEVRGLLRRHLRLLSSFSACDMPYCFCAAGVCSCCKPHTEDFGNKPTATRSGL